MTRPYTGKPYTPSEVRALFIEETPEKMTMHSQAGRRTLPADEGQASRATTRAITPIVQPEWSSDFYRLMADDTEMAKGKNWWYIPVRRALVLLGKPSNDWGDRRRSRRALVHRCMTLYLISNYDVGQIAAATGLKQHEAQRALEDGAREMSRWIGVFGDEFRAWDPMGFRDGLRT